MVDISNSEKHGVDHTLNLRIHACAPGLCIMTITTYQSSCASVSLPSRGSILQAKSTWSLLPPDWAVTPCSDALSMTVQRSIL